MAFWVFTDGRHRLVLSVADAYAYKPELEVEGSWKREGDAG